MADNEKIMEKIRALLEKTVENGATEQEAIEAAKSGRMTEAFASGTACVIAPMGLLNYKGENYPINGEQVGPLSKKLFDTLYGMQTGVLPDEMGGWVVTL